MTKLLFIEPTVSIWEYKGVKLMARIRISERSLTGLLRTGGYSRGRFEYRSIRGQGGELYIGRRARGSSGRFDRQLITSESAYQYVGLRDMIRDLTKRARYELRGFHIWSSENYTERPESAAIRINNAKLVNSLFERSRLTIGEIMSNLEGRYGDEIERQIERIIFGIYDPVYRPGEVSTGRVAWVSAVNSLARALGLSDVFEAV